nr:MAG TPA: hypothetical protein [Caudoviricetes sp.]
MGRKYRKKCDKTEKRFYNAINDFISDCKKKEIETRFVDSELNHLIFLVIEKDGAAVTLSYPKKLVYYEYDIENIKQDFCDMMHMFEAQYEEKNNGRKIL